MFGTDDSANRLRNDKKNAEADVCVWRNPSTVAYGLILSGCAAHVLFLFVISLSAKLHFINLRRKNCSMEMEANERNCSVCHWQHLRSTRGPRSSYEKKIRRAPQRKILAVCFFFYLRLRSNLSHTRDNGRSKNACHRTNAGFRSTAIMMNKN